MPRQTRIVVVGVLMTVGGLSGAATVAAHAQDQGPPPTLRFPGDRLELPMPTSGGRATVEVRIGDAGPYRFLIDTGAGVSVVDSRIATALGLEPIGHMDVGVPGGRQVPADRVLVPTLRVGDLVIEDARPVVLDIAAMTHGAMDGVLGLDVFGSVLLTLDPVNARAVVSRGALTREMAGVVVLDTAGGRLAFDIDVAGHTVPTQIDTGSPAGFTFPASLMATLPSEKENEREAVAGLVGGERAVRVRRLEGTIRFAGLEFVNPTVGFMDPSPPVANIGTRVLAELAITIDQRNGLLAVRRVVQNGDAGRKVGARAIGPRRLGVRLGGPGGDLSRVSSVDPGSLGEQAGFTAGDVIRSINGRPMSQFDQASLGALIRGGEPLTFVLMRGTEEHVLKIP